MRRSKRHRLLAADERLARSHVGKRRFHTLEHADWWARRLERKDGAQMNAYRCLVCEAWHVGHTLGSAKPGEREA